MLDEFFFLVELPGTELASVLGTFTPSVSENMGLQFVGRSKGFWTILTLKWLVTGMLPTDMQLHVSLFEELELTMLASKWPLLGVGRFYVVVQTRLALEGFRAKFAHQ